MPKVRKQFSNPHFYSDHEITCIFHRYLPLKIFRNFFHHLGFRSYLAGPSGIWSRCTEVIFGQIEVNVPEKMRNKFAQIRSEHGSALLEFIPAKLAQPVRLILGYLRVIFILYLNKKNCSDWSKTEFLANF